MKPRPFAYVRPRTIEEAFDLFERHGEEARILAGGQSLLAGLNMRLSAPAILVDISHIPGLRGVESEAGVVRIGALTRHAEVEASAVVASDVPLLAQAMPHVAHHAIRTRGTIGGSIAYADPAAELPAVCCALGATFILQSRAGERRVAADDFFLGLFETVLQPGEILTAVELPAAKPGERFGFMELARRHGDYAIVGIAARAQVRDGAWSDVRLAYLGGGDRPAVAHSAARALDGRDLDAQAIASAQNALSEDLSPPADLNGPPAMKLHLARVLTARVLNRMAS